ncbi:MAG: methylated-DNA--[protein]-cysteine S-methyltransferase [Gemmatimonadales bacterium]
MRSGRMEGDVDIEWNLYESPIGTLQMVEAPPGPIMLGWPRRGNAWIHRIAARRPDLAIRTGPCFATRGWLDAYFAGHFIRFPFPGYLTEFISAPPSALSVWEAICSIPHGETSSYGSVARRTGLHARAAGRMVGRNQLAILIPCHRVVGKDGALVGYGGGLARKRWLLDHELRSGGLKLQ